jgi:hypothetical protein
MWRDTASELSTTASMPRGDIVLSHTMYNAHAVSVLSLLTRAYLAPGSRRGQTTPARPAHTSTVASHTASLWLPFAEKRHNRPGTEVSIDAYNCDGFVLPDSNDLCGQAPGTEKSAENDTQCRRLPDFARVGSARLACASHPEPPLSANVHRTLATHHTERCTARKRPHLGRARTDDSSGSSTASICSCTYAAEHPQKCGNPSLVRT